MIFSCLGVTQNNVPVKRVVLEHVGRVGKKKKTNYMDGLIEGGTDRQTGRQADKQIDRFPDN